MRCYSKMKLKSSGVTGAMVEGYVRVVARRYEEG